jgi:hypothetical protein
MIMERQNLNLWLKDLSLNPGIEQIGSTRVSVDLGAMQP